MVVRKLLAVGLLVAVAGTGAAFAAAPSAPVAQDVSARVPAVEVAPDPASNSLVKVIKGDSDCGGAGFSKITVPLSKRGYLCVHAANDLGPTHAQALAQAPAAPSKGPATAPVVCHGDGTTGSRVQVIYGYHDGLPNRSKTVVDQFRRLMAPRINAVLKNQSAGRDLSMRFVHLPGCGPIDVKVIKFPRSVQYATDPADPGGQIGRAANTLAAMGYNRPDRKYTILWDGWNGPACGIGEIIPFAPISSVPRAMTNEGLPSLGARSNPDVTGEVSKRAPISTYSMTFNHAGGPNGGSCFMSRGLSTVSTVIHEIFHTLGAVQLDAPHADTGHCQDAPSIMCSGFSEGYGKGVYIKACGNVKVETLDCGMDDYWSPTPVVGEYLFDHYNIARSAFFGPQYQDQLAASPL